MSEEIQFVGLRDLFSWHRLFTTPKTALFIALGVYLTKGNGRSPEVWLAMFLATTLYFLLYIANEAGDSIYEAHLKVYKSTKCVIGIGLVAILIASSWLSWKITLILLGMIIFQLIYSLSSIRWKQFWLLSLAIRGFINPLLRIVCGAVFGRIPGVLITISALGVLFALNVSSALNTAAKQKERNDEHGYQNPPELALWFGKVLGIVGGAGLVGIVIAGILPSYTIWFITLGIVFFAATWLSKIPMSRLRKGWGLISVVMTAYTILLLLWK
jgi:hypothetical protein